MLIRFRNYLLPYYSNLHFIFWQSTRSRVKTSSETGARPFFRLIPREFHGSPSLALATASSSTSEGRTTAAEDEAQKQQSASEDGTAKSNSSTDSSSNIAEQDEDSGKYTLNDIIHLLFFGTFCVFPLYCLYFMFIYPPKHDKMLSDIAEEFAQKKEKEEAEAKRNTQQWEQQLLASVMQELQQERQQHPSTAGQQKRPRLQR